jgi:hypothetical protein
MKRDARKLACPECGHRGPFGWYSSAEGSIGDGNGAIRPLAIRTPMPNSDDVLECRACRTSRTLYDFVVTNAGIMT